MMYANVVGAGLAGCEAAFRISKSGFKVRLFDMKPEKRSPAHSSKLFAELVCSNSFKAIRAESAAGLLKEEMRRLDSLLLKCADACRVPAGGALAVDRDIFSRLVTAEIESDKNIEVISEEVIDIPDDSVTVISTGPLTSDPLAEKFTAKFGASLSFFDAAAPVISFESIDMSKAFFASRYGKGGGDDYINCPMSKKEYETFFNALLSAERAPLKDFDVRDPKVYEGCMPVEVMARRGSDTLRFGPMKPVGLTDPKMGKRPWAVLQLRKENSSGTMYNLVGFQTNLKFPEQKRVFSLIPGLENAEFLRYGVMHRNIFLNSPKILNPDFSVKENPNLFFAGQITGVEGYMESAASGIIAGINAVKRLRKEETLIFPRDTELGALAAYVSDGSVSNFQPMGANFGILPTLEAPPRDKRLRGAAYSQRALKSLDEFIRDSKIANQREIRM